MSNHSHSWLAATIAGLALAAALTVACDPWYAAERSARFQQGVGGLGFGPAVDLSLCEFAFDPRLAPACAADLGPVPGGAWPCRCHPGVAFAYPALPADAPPARPEPEPPLEKGRHAPLP